MTTPDPLPEPDAPRPPEHERLIALMQQGTAPAATPDAPAMPDELLRELEQHFASTQQTQPTLVALPAAISAAAPSRQAKAGFSRRISRLAWAAAATVVLGISLLQWPTPQKDLLRGGQGSSSAPARYWLGQGTLAQPPARLAEGLILSTEPPATGTVLVLDPATASVRLLRDGVEVSRRAVSDITDAEAWLEALQGLQ